MPPRFFTFVLVLQKALWDQNTQQKAQQTKTVNLTNTTKEVINLLGVLQVSKETKEVNRRSTGKAVVKRALQRRVIKDIKTVGWLQGPG